MKKAKCVTIWYITIELMLNFLIFVTSIREGNFSLYVWSLKQVVKWYYACDHYQYARWATVHLYDLVNLPTTSPYLHKCFSDDHKDNEAFQNQFSADVSRLKTSSLTNPFRLNKLTVLSNKNSLLMILCMMIFLKCQNYEKNSLKRFGRTGLWRAKYQ